MRLPSNPTIANVSPDLLRLISKINAQINGITEGTASAFHTAATAAPTTGTWARGDFVLNSAPAETGGLKYIIRGWRCTVAGTPGTWVEERALTGGGVNVTKLLTATAVLDFASIAISAVGSLNITVTGAAAGDTVLLAPPAALEAGLMFSGLVTAANTVTIRVANITAAAVDPASATWRATVMGFA